MAATKRSTDYLINESTGSFKDANNITAGQARDMIFSAYQPQAFCNGRLTLESGVPISTTDQAAKTNIYFTPYLGNCIGIFDGTSWTLRTFSELTLALGTLTSGKNYDVFVYDNSGTLTLEALVWTDDTTRATALALQDGVYSKTGALTRRYLGTFRTTATTTTEDSNAKRFVWNAYNQVPRKLFVTDTTNTWTYSTAAWAQANASAANQVAVVVGLAGASLMSLLVSDIAKTSLTDGMSNGIGENSVTAIVGQTGYNEGAVYHQLLGGYAGHPRLGYSYYSWLEYGSGTGTNTWVGDAGAPTVFGTGLSGSINA